MPNPMLGGGLLPPPANPTAKWAAGFLAPFAQPFLDAGTVLGEALRTGVAPRPIDLMQGGVGLAMALLGPKAATADLGAMAVAKRMAAAGKGATPRSAQPLPGPAKAKAKGTTMHEIMHEIQDVEDFAKGGATEYRGTPPGIRAYHISPYDFEKFDIGKIGTGEGAQVYGHGIYTAESPSVSGQGGAYWHTFLSHPSFSITERRAAALLKDAGFDRKKAIEMAKANLKEPDKIIKLLKSGKPIGPRTYEVNIKARPEQFLDWDKPLGEQSKEVKDLVKKYALDNNISGEEAYHRIAQIVHKRNLQPGNVPQDPKVYASEQLKAAGIPGIRYLDQGSRQWGDPEALRRSISSAKEHLQMWEQATQPESVKTAQKSFIQQQINRSERSLKRAESETPTHNYVVFDPAIVDILKKYGLAGLLAGGAATSMMPIPKKRESMSTIMNGL